MRQLTTWLAWIAPVVALAPLGLAQCSGDNSNVTSDAGSKGGGSSGGGSGSSSGSGSPGDDDSSVVSPGDDSGGGPIGDGGVAPGSGDGGPDAAPSGPPPIPVPEGGAPSDPGSIVCNGAACDVSHGSTCCYAKTDAGSTETCNPANTGCATETLACNEASDCNGGLCCQTIIGIGLQGSTFCSAPSAKACPGASAMYPEGTFQTCRTDGECGASSDAGALKRCIPQICTSPTTMATMVSNTVTIEACAEATTAQNDAGTLAFCKPL
jgi:hypothetical protein